MASSHNTRLLWRIALPMGLVALALLVLVVTVSADSPPPASGDWYVGDPTTIDGRDIMVHGNVTIEARGDLTLVNLTLTMDPLVDGGCGIYVTEWNKLRMHNVSVLSSDPDKHYWFEIRGEAEIRGCDIRDVAANDVSWTSWNTIKGGVQVYSDATILVDSSFHHCQRINVLVDRCEPTIERCSFSDAEYVNSYASYRYDNSHKLDIYAIYTDATGLYLRWADLLVKDCTFKGNGLSSTVLDLYNTNYTHNAIVTMGRGILAYESSPIIIGCQFIRNGEQPENRTVEGISQMFWDFPFGTHPIEGGIACTGSDIRPTITGCAFDGNDVYGICADNGYTIDRYLEMTIEGCRIERTSLLAGDQSYGVTAGVYVNYRDSDLTISNTTIQNNTVDANIWASGASLKMTNVTSEIQMSIYSYNIFIAEGIHEISSCVLRASTATYANIFVGYVRVQTWLYINQTGILGGGYALNVDAFYSTYVRMMGCQVSGQSDAAFRLWNTILDCIDCDLPWVIHMDPNGDARSEVNIYHYLEVLVTWQNDVPIPGAHVQVNNPSGDFLFSDFADANGTVGPDLVLAWSYLLRSHVIEVSHSPLRLQALSRGIMSGPQYHVFTSDTKVTVKIFDWRSPTLTIFNPIEGHAQNTTTLEVNGVCTDPESGIKSVEVREGSSPWVPASVHNMTWSVALKVGEGVHEIEARAMDYARNMVNASVANVTVDLTPPRIEIMMPEYPGALRNTTAAMIVGTSEPGARVLIGWKQEVDNTDGKFAAWVDLTMEGGNDFWVIVIDPAENVNRMMVSFTRDTLPPKILIDDRPILTKEIAYRVSGSVHDLHPGTASVNGLPIEDGTFNITMDLQEGANVITLMAKDAAGNLVIVLHQVMLDTVIPLVEMDSPTGNLVTNATNITVRGHVYGGFETLSINGETVEAPSGTFKRLMFLIEGLNLITLNVTDQVGNYRSWTYRVTSDTMPPAIVLDRDYDYIVTNQESVIIRGRVVGATTLLIDGIAFDTGADFEFSHGLEETGPFGDPNVLVIRASDDAGNTAEVILHIRRDTISPSIRVDEPPQTTRELLMPISGRVKNVTDLVTLTINGTPLTVAANGTFLGLVPLDIGNNILIIRGVDMAGNEATVTHIIERLPIEEDANTGPLVWALLGGMLILGALSTIYLGRRGVLKSVWVRWRR